MLARFALIACAFGLFLAAGCGPAKLNVAQKLDLEAVNPKAIDLTAQPKPQKISVEFSSPDEIDVFVLKEADAKGEEGLQNADVAAKQGKALAQKKGKGETFTVDVPENTAVRIVFLSRKKTTVDVKLTN